MPATSTPAEYGCHSRDFLSRAVLARRRWKDEGQLAYFFYAALELRNGIEARLHEHLAASQLMQMGSWKPSQQYSATRLLRELAKVNPAASTQVTVIVGSEGAGRKFVHEPITPELASIHGQLGELLHHNFFLSESNAPRINSTRNLSSEAIDAKDELLYRGIDELERCVNSNFVITPDLLATIQEFVDKHVK